MRLVTIALAVLIAHSLLACSEPYKERPRIEKINNPALTAELQDLIDKKKEVLEAALRKHGAIISKEGLEVEPCQQTAAEKAQGSCLSSVTVTGEHPDKNLVGYMPPQELDIIPFFDVMLFERIGGKWYFTPLPGVNEDDPNYVDVYRTVFVDDKLEDWQLTELRAKK